MEGSDLADLARWCPKYSSLGSLVVVVEVFFSELTPLIGPLVPLFLVSYCSLLFLAVVEFVEFVVV